MPIRLVVFDWAGTLVDGQSREMLPGAIECILALRQRGIRIATTSDEPHDGYCASAREQSYVPDHSVATDEVPQGRPAPWMMFRIMEKLGIFPSRAVVKIGDTREDIEEGLNAGAWTVGVVDSSCELGMSRAKFAALDEEDRERLRAEQRERFLEAGADATIDSLIELIEAIDAFDRLQN